jgi:hypothetical protein
MRIRARAGNRAISIHLVTRKALVVKLVSSPEVDSEIIRRIPDELEVAFGSRASRSGRAAQRSVPALLEVTI